MMTRVLFLLAVESACFALICLPALLLILNAAGGVKLTLYRIFMVLVILFVILLFVDLVGTYYEKSSFVGLFTASKYLWYLALPFYLVDRLVRKYITSKTCKS